MIRLLNPELGLINTHDPIPLYVAASGPRARALTAKLGAGWIATAGDVEGGVAAMTDMRERWRAHRRGQQCGEMVGTAHSRLGSPCSRGPSPRPSQMLQRVLRGQVYYGMGDLDRAAEAEHTLATLRDATAAQNNKYWSDQIEVQRRPGIGYPSENAQKTPNGARQWFLPSPRPWA